MSKALPPGFEITDCWYVGAGLGDGVRPVHHARWATSRSDGTFVLEASGTRVSTWLTRSYGPKFAFVHPEYGLQRQAQYEGDVWLLQGDPRRLAQARRDLDPYCRGEYSFRETGRR